MKLAEKILERRSGMDVIRKRRELFDGKWLDAKITEIRDSKHGKGKEITVMLDKKYHDQLPSMVEGDLVKTKKEYKKGDRVKVQLYFSASNTLIDKIK